MGQSFLNIAGFIYSIAIGILSHISCYHIIFYVNLDMGSMNIRSIADLLELFEKLPQTARARG